MQLFLKNQKPILNVFIFGLHLKDNEALKLSYFYD